MKTKLSKLVQQLNAENDKPEEGKVYALTGGPGSRCIANGNSWSESEVTDADPAARTNDRGTR